MWCKWFHTKRMFPTTSKWWLEYPRQMCIRWETTSWPWTSITKMTHTSCASLNQQSEAPLSVKEDHTTLKPKNSLSEVKTSRWLQLRFPIPGKKCKERLQSRKFFFLKTLTSCVTTAQSETRATAFLTELRRTRASSRTSLGSMLRTTRRLLLWKESRLK